MRRSWCTVLAPADLQLAGTTNVRDDLPNLPFWPPNADPFTGQTIVDLTLTIHNAGPAVSPATTVSVAWRRHSRIKIRFVRQEPSWTEPPACRVRDQTRFAFGGRQCRHCEPGKQRRFTVGQSSRGSSAWVTWWSLAASRSIP